MTARFNERRRTMRVPLTMDQKIERYAEQHGFSYSEAARDLWERALAKDFDQKYAPRINKITQRIADRAVGRIESLGLHACNVVLAELRLSEYRMAVLFSELEKDEPVDEGGYNPNVFIPERRPGEKEIIWPR